tara:strand:- start:52 stop:204 length:153 start_codon:yes stop_codon:yes gene_type:complete
MTKPVDRACVRLKLDGMDVAITILSGKLEDILKALGNEEDKLIGTGRESV